MENQDDQQKKMSEYAAKVKALWKAEGKIQLDYQSNASEIAQFNKREKQPARGKAASYYKDLDSCKFKLVLYYIRKKDGTYWSDVECKRGANRWPIPSLDLSGTSGNYIIDHETSYEKLMDKFFDEIENVHLAQMYLMDRVNEIEYKIMEFNPKIKGKCLSVQPRFKDHKQHRVFDFLDGTHLGQPSQIRYYGK